MNFQAHNNLTVSLLISFRCSIIHCKRVKARISKLYLKIDYIKQKVQTLMKFQPDSESSYRFEKKVCWEVCFIQFWYLHLLPVFRMKWFKIYNLNAFFSDRKHASTHYPAAFRSVHTGIEPPFFYQKYIMQSPLAWLRALPQKILTKREIINCQKINFLLCLTMNSVTTGVRELKGTSQMSLLTHNAKGEMREI